MVLAGTLALVGIGNSTVAQCVPAAADSITLLGRMGFGGRHEKSDVWGWLDPVTLKEYAIVGLKSGPYIFIIDVSDPTAPFVASRIDNTHSFDVKTWSHFLYAVDGGGTGMGGSIYDIADPTAPVLIGSFPSAHNVFIDDRGILYHECPGLTISDLNPDPGAPMLLWSGGDEDGHDATVVGTTLYDFHGCAGTFIYDVTDPAMPVLKGGITEAGILFNHSGWPSADGNYLYINDESAYSNMADITVWDISDPASPFRVDAYRDSTATIHNTYGVSHFLFASYYVAGLKVFDIEDPLDIELVDEYDTTPKSGDGVQSGAWGCYPFAPSGNIYVSDMDNGLFIFSFSGLEPKDTTRTVPPGFTLKPNYPNPFLDVTVVDYVLSRASIIDLPVFSATGRKVRGLFRGLRPSGPGSAVWDGNDDAGRRVPSGLYFCRLQARGREVTRKMVFLK